MQKKYIQAEIINIGDELLIGQIVNTNASMIASQLNTIGIMVECVTTIGDKKQDIESAFSKALNKYDIVFVTGGLGTTNDDITKECICNYFNTQLVENQQIKKHIADLCQERHYKVSETIYSQAFIPENCQPIDNKVGIAPGMWIETNGKVLISTPGVPAELEGMLVEICKKIQEKFIPSTKIDKHFKLSGISETLLSDTLQDFENQLPDFIKLAYLPKMGTINLRLSGSHIDGNLLQQKMDFFVQQLTNLVQPYLICLEDKDLSVLIGELLHAKGQTIATAESCTGGFIAHKITSIAGSSSYFKGGVVSYDNSVKINILNVEKQRLAEDGAVSEYVAKTMANNVRKLLDVDYSVAVSGIAGPSGGTKEKPIGMVWIAVANNKKTIAQCFYFGSGRKRVIERTSEMALLMLYQLINNLI